MILNVPECSYTARVYNFNNLYVQYSVQWQLTPFVLKIWNFYSPVPQGGYLGGSRPMLPCVTLCPLISVKILALKGLKG